MSDHISTLAQKLRPYWLRDQTNGSGGVAASGGGGGGMAAHALFGVYHTGELDPSQAPWAVTQDDLDAIDVHERQHDVFDPADHIANGAAGQLAGFTALNTWGKLTPTNGLAASGSNLGVVVANTGATGLTVESSAVRLTSSSAPGATAKVLATDSSGLLTLNDLVVGTAMRIAGTNEVNTEPDIKFFTNGLMAAEGSVYVVIDGDNTGTDAIFSIRHDTFLAGTAVEIARFTETGRLGIGDPSPSYELDVAGTARATVALRTVNTYSTAGVQTPEVTTASGRLSLASSSGAVRITASIPIIDTSSGTSLFMQPADYLVFNPGANQVRLLDGKSMRTEEFVSGFAGNGFRLDQGISRAGHTSLELDDLVVRGRMSVYELLIRQIRATNGSLFVTSTAKIKRVAPVSGGYRLWTITAEETPTATTDHAHGFLPNDLIRAQRTRWNGTTLVAVYQSDLRVTVVEDLYTFLAVLVSGDVPDAGMDYVRLGNSTDVNRQGSLYLTADDTNSPFMDVVDDINEHSDWNTSGKVKVRIGKLTGITDQPNEYGIIAGDSGFADTDSWIRASNLSIELHNTPLNMYDGSTRKVHIGAWDDVWLGPSSADKRLYWDGITLTIVGHVSATTGTIANWDIGVVNANTISSSNIEMVSGSGAHIAVGDFTTANIAGMYRGTVAGSTAFFAGSTLANRAIAPFRVTLGGSLYASSADITGNINATTGTIANWEIGVVDANTISAASGNIKLIAGGSNVARLEVGTGTAGTGGGIANRTTGPSTMIWAGSPYATSVSAPFRVTLAGDVYASNADITGTVTATAGAIGGWALSSTIISSTNARLVSGSGARLELGSYTTANTAGVAGGASSGAVVFWAGQTFALRTTAPYQVTLGGALTSTSATFGSPATTLVDATGIYINAQTAWNVDYGYKFKIAGNVGAGMTSVYAAGDHASTQIWHNTDTESSISPLISGVNSNLIIRGVAGGAGKQANVELTASHSSAGTNARFVVSNDGTNRVVRGYGSAFYFNNGSDRVVYHDGNLNLSLYATVSSLSAYAPLASPAFTGTVTLPITKYSPRTSSSAPSLADGEVLVFTIYNGTVHRYVIAYNHGGTIKYRYWNLDETGVPVWNYSTTFSGVYD